MDYKYLIVDGPYLAHRSFGAPYKLSTTTGLDATMIHSFIRTLNSLRKKFNPQEIIVAWESYGTSSWRKEMQPDYKPNGGTSITRQYIDESIDLQLLLYLFGVKQYYASHNEADDVIANLVFSTNENVLIFTVDKDMMQLVEDYVHVYNGEEIFDEKKVKEKYKVEPFQIPDYLAIVGDTSDNIKGIQGYGPVRASKILADHIHVEGIPSDHELSVHQKELEFNKKLAVLNHECKLIPIPNKDFKTSETIISIFDKYEFKQLKEKIEEYKLLGGNKNVISTTTAI